MKKKKNQLLPEGFKVLLPEEAEKEELLSRKILDILINNDYSLVKTHSSYKIRYYTSNCQASLY